MRGGLIEWMLVKIVNVTLVRPAKVDVKTANV
ncbi:hypothetical protein FF011L_22080 [Roseimaritima multifibrata]|uniref:Uncharacterized protein n=1 Tax=Roseimaritima multifibrata TaxID=1930274 RepID=A0A517MEY3_9BACT|nr:hypothetical protein FF011L_22080 [Roseimaritima multifibrata]